MYLQIRRHLRWARHTGLAICLLALPAPALAFYDDFHYGVTYLVARMVGYTPIQSYRMASACISIDYADTTEPVQNVGFDIFAKLEAAPIPLETLWRWLRAGDQNEIPRVRFHAFRDETRFPKAQSNRTAAKRADAAILERRDALYKLALKQGNPGIFLHFLQDMLPHRGYGSRYGHWGNHTLFGNVEAGRPLGGTTDWISFRREDDIEQVVRETARWLIAYMNDASNGQQKPRFTADNPLPPANYWMPALRRLGQVNKFPTPLGEYEFEDGRPASVIIELLAVGRLRSGDQASTMAQLVRVPEVHLEDLRHIRDPENPRTNLRWVEYTQHAKGPNVLAAIAEVESFLRNKGAVEPNGVPRAPYEYSLTAEERQTVLVEGRRDPWVIYGSIAALFPASTTSATLTVVQPPTWSGEKEEIVTEQTIPAGTPEFFVDHLPLGDLKIILRRESGQELVKEVRLSKWHDTVNFGGIDYGKILADSAQHLGWFGRPGARTRNGITMHFIVDKSINGRLMIRDYGDAEKAASFVTSASSASAAKPKQVKIGGHSGVILGRQEGDGTGGTITTYIVLVPMQPAVVEAWLTVPGHGESTSEQRAVTFATAAVDRIAASID